jgi:hypothetical protein
MQAKIAIVLLPATMGRAFKTSAVISNFGGRSPACNQLEDLY